MQSGDTTTVWWRGRRRWVTDRAAAHVYSSYARAETALGYHCMDAPAPKGVGSTTSITIDEVR